MATPARPSSGAVVESAWGGAAHDAAVGVIGVTATSGGATATAVTFVLSPSQGRVSMISGTDCIVPIAGWWEVFAYVQASPPTGGIFRAFIDTNVSGSFAGLVHAGSPGVTGWGIGLSMGTLVNLSAGNIIRVRADASVAMALGLSRLVVAFRGTELL